MCALNTKQIPVCKKCHKFIHKAKDKGKKFSELYDSELVLRREISSEEKKESINEQAMEQIEVKKSTSERVMEFLDDKNFTNKLTITQSIGEAPKEKCDRTLEGLAKDKKTDLGIILIAVAYLLQQGGTSKKVNADQSVTIKGIKLTMCEMHTKCNENKTTPRQFARGIKYDISDIMIRLASDFLPGNQFFFREISLKQLR